MTVIRKRPRVALVIGFLIYMLVGFRVSDVQSLESTRQNAGPCPAPLHRHGSDGEPVGNGRQARAEGITLLQGNAWMLPSRPLLMPFAFSVDRAARLERLVQIIRACRPDVVVLQEIFEEAMVRILAGALPDYRTLSSGRTDLTGMVNVSGLVTLTRLPVQSVEFLEFEALPPSANLIERLGRKGLLAVEVLAPGFRGTIVNLHLYAARNASEAELTKSQLLQVLAFATAKEAAGRAPFLVGDFNLEPREAGPFLPAGWEVPDHGATYDPVRNRYAVEGSNNTPSKHDDRRFGRGVRRVDWMVNPAPGRVTAVSRVLDSLELSDHYFLQHLLLPSRG